MFVSIGVRDTGRELYLGQDCDDGRANMIYLWAFFIRDKGYSEQDVLFFFFVNHYGDVIIYWLVGGLTAMQSLLLSSCRCWKSIN